MDNITLAVLAAGMGSRFGGLKQIEKIDERGQVILDYSLYDAISVGFSKVVFIIRKEMKEDFMSIISTRQWFRDINVEFVFQEIDDIPKGFQLPNGRKKPWGTAHAIASLYGAVNSPFAVINADDFYGRKAFGLIANCLKSGENCMVGYKLKNTLSKSGKVSRGICESENGYITNICEKWGIAAKNDKIIGGNNAVLDENANVSMNLWGFTPNVINECKDRFASFLKQNLKENPKACEYYLPSVISEMISEGSLRIRLFETDDKWYGITYKNDKSEVSLALEKMVKMGIYPTYL